jgi:ParB family chromosome partitioning protein
MRSAAGSRSVQPAPEPAAEPEEDEGIKPLPDRLITELTTHRTLALRRAIGDQPQVAFLAALHALCLKLFYPYAQDTCLELDIKQIAFGAQAPGLSETEPAKAIGARHQSWASALPREATDLWDALEASDDGTRQRLFAHCVGSSVNAVHEAFSRRPRALTHADRLAEAVHLDMAAAGWRPTVDSYLGRVTKSRILQAVREAKGEQAAQLIDHLKKPEMAKEAERLLGGTGWLPEPLRAMKTEMAGNEQGGEAEALPDFLAAKEDGANAPYPEEPQALGMAAE